MPRIRSDAPNADRSSPPHAPAEPASLQPPTVASFVWPPRRPDAAPSPNPNSIKSATTSASITPVSNPLPRSGHPPTSSLDSAAPTLESSRIEHSISAQFHSEPAPARRFDLQRTWLDLLVPPLRHRLLLLNWQQEARTAYCHRCGKTIGPHDAADDGCSACAGEGRPWSNLVRLGEYAEPLSNVVHEVKFTKWRRLAHDAGQLLGQTIASEIERHRHSISQYLARPPIIVPVPISFRRRLVRGIDHSLALARGMRDSFECELVMALGRRHRPSQLTVAPYKRATNVAGTMWLRVPTHRLSGRLVIVVDDVTTTGATLKAACRPIQEGFSPRNGKEQAKNRHQSPTKNLKSRMHQSTPLLWTAVLTVTQIGDD